MSGFSRYRALVRKDLVCELRSREQTVSMLVYASAIIMVLGICMSFVRNVGDLAEAGGGLMWVAIVFISLSGLGRSFERERRNGCLEGLLLAPVDRGTVYLAKVTSNLILLIAVEIVAVPVFWFFFPAVDVAPTDLLMLCIPLLIGSVGIAGVGTVLATVTSDARGSDVLLALLFIPILFPLLYSCVGATAAILGGEGSEILPLTLALGVAFDCIMIPVSWLLYDFAVGTRNGWR